MQTSQGTLIVSATFIIAELMIKAAVTTYFSFRERKVAKEILAKSNARDEPAVAQPVSCLRHDNRFVRRRANSLTPP